MHSWEMQQLLSAPDGIEVFVSPETRVLGGFIEGESAAAAAAAISAWPLPSTMAGHGPHGGSSTGLPAMPHHQQRPAEMAAAPISPLVPAKAAANYDRHNYSATFVDDGVLLSNYPAAPAAALPSGTGHLSMPLPGLLSSASAPLPSGSVPAERSSSPTSVRVAGRSRREYRGLLCGRKEIRQLSVN